MKRKMKTMFGEIEWEDKNDVIELVETLEYKLKEAYWIATVYENKLHELLGDEKYNEYMTYVFRLILERDKENNIKEIMKGDENGEGEENEEE